MKSVCFAECLFFRGTEHARRMRLVVLLAIAVAAAAPARGQQIVATIPVAGGPVGLGLSPDQLFLYVCNLGTDLVQIIDISKRQVVDSIRTDQGAIWIAMRPNSTEAYVARAAADTETGTCTGKLKSSKRTQGEHSTHNDVFAPEGSL